jgi:glucose-6-phosphate dehydrogenase assembly protein OpcA
VTGAVRVADALDDDQTRTVLNAALDWGHKAPRKAALERLLACGDDELVQALAANDPDASIRQWASEQLANKATQGGLFD